MMLRVPTRPFLPSVHGCGFGNAESVGLRIQIGAVPVAKVPGGLCGGMVLDSLRSWRLGLPPATRSSADLTRVFGAQLRSFQIPTAPSQYLRLQHPRSVHARRVSNQRALDEIVRHLRDGAPIPVALVCRLSTNPFALAAHHVVLAYRIRARDSASATFGVYDPNYPGDDNVALRISADEVQHSHRSAVHATFTLHAR